MGGLCHERDGEFVLADLCSVLNMVSVFWWEERNACGEKQLMFVT